MEQGTGIFSVAIDFDQSHLFFPGIIQWVLLILAVAIALVHGREFARNIRGASLLPDRDSFDVVRVLGTLGLVVLYFVSMNWVGVLSGLLDQHEERIARLEAAVQRLKEEMRSK